MRLLRIVGTYIIFNEKDFIKESVESVLWCDKIIIIDGAYEGYPSPTPWSNDGTIDIIAELQKKHSHIKFVPATRFYRGFEKVEAYLPFISEGDFFIRMNGDEIFEGDSARLCTYIEKTERLPMYQLAEYPDGLPNKYHYCPKILRNLPGLKPTSKHVALTNSFVPSYITGCHEHGKVEPLDANIPIQFGALRHMRELRCAQRAKERDGWLRYYYAHGSAHENC